MSPGIPEEAGQTARSFFDALKEQPLSLALVVVIMFLLGFLYFFAVSAKEERQRELELLYQNRSEVAQLLARCVEPEVITKQLDQNRRSLDVNRQELEQLLELLKKRGLGG